MRWIVLGLVTGVVSGLAAVVFVGGLEYVSHFTMTELAGVTIPQPPGEQFIEFEPSDTPRRAWLFFLLPAIGGLISGFLVYRYAPEAEGPGTDAMIRSFHRERGEMRPRVPLVKGLATIATLATGGSAGKEGPIAQIGAGIGSILGSKLGLTAKDRRILLLAGTAGGLGAVFRAPLGSAITAIEVLYREDFESDALIPCVISSVMAYVTFVMCLGGARIFDVPQIDLISPIEVPGYLLLALVTVPVGTLFIRTYYGMRDKLFRRLPLPRPLIPMIGGLGVGLIGFWFPQAYGAGWGYVQQALDGELVIQTMLFVLFAKLFATSLTIGSGGSGGVFGPILFMGGMLGGVIGYGGHELAPHLFPNPGAYVLVGMASFFAGVASAPIGAMLMVTEMTGGYALLPPLMLVSVVAIILMRNQSIYEAQVADRFHSPAHVGDLTINVLEHMKVEDVYRKAEKVTTVTPATSFRTVRNLIMGSRDATVPVVNEDGGLVGLITAEQLRPVMDEHQLDAFVVAGDIAAPAYSLRPDDDLARAHQLFHASGCPQIPVLGAAGEDEVAPLLGMIDYRELMRAYEKELAARREH